MNILELENVHASYKKREVLKGINLSIKPGEIVTLIGPNGAGKSTLLKVIAGILKPAAGNVIYNGININRFSTDRRAREGIGYLMQGGQVFNRLNVQENLEIGGLNIAGYGLKKQMQRVLNLFPELKEVLKQRAGLMSGGQREMLAIGMVLMQDVKILLLDEPSAGLSPNLVANLIIRINQLVKIFGITILLVEQNLREAKKLNPHFYIIQNGSIVYNYESYLLDESKIEEVFFLNNS